MRRKKVMEDRIDIEKDPIFIDIDVSNEGGVDRDLEPIQWLIDKLSPIMLIVYIHGWKHSRSNDHLPDSDRNAFKQALKRAQVSLSVRDDKKLIPVGIFVRWNARILPGKLENICYWFTRNRATRIANRGNLSDLLGKLSSHTKEVNKDSEVVLTGHSMGARILGRSMLRSPCMKNSADLLMLVNSADDHKTGKLIINNQFSDNDRVKTYINGKDIQIPRLVWITSIVDKATSIIFPLAELKSKIKDTHKFDNY